MMKTKDISVATSLIIQGFTRANVAEVPDDNGPAAMAQLAKCLQAVRSECDDWSENLPVPDGADSNALEPKMIDVGLSCGQAIIDRSPYNIVSGAIALLAEAIDLNGPESTAGDLLNRLPVELQVALKEAAALA